MENINIESIKAYNNELKTKKEQKAKVETQLFYKEQELNKVCAELSAVLGITVDKTNISKIYSEQLEKINSTMQNGKEILKRIAEEEIKQNNQNINV